MISLNESRGAQCDVRLSLKTQDQTLMRQAMDGAGLTRWEAAVLPRVVEDIYFQGGLNRPWKDGQIRYQCVDITAGPGRQRPRGLVSRSDASWTREATRWVERSATSRCAWQT
jgi:hypothetical protein